MTASPRNNLPLVLAVMVAAALSNVAACSGDDGLPPLVEDGATTTGTGGERSAASGAGGRGGAGEPGGGGGRAATGSSGRGGAAGEAGADGQPGPGGDGGSGGARSGPPVIALCDQPLTLGEATRLDISTSSDDLLGAVTPDELVIAWIVVEASTVTMYYASRTNSDEPFGAASTLLIDAAPDPIALSPDGLRALFVDADRRGFSSVTRSSVEEPFGDPGKMDLELLEPDTAQLPEDEAYADPVLAPTDLSLYFSRFGGGRTMTLFVSDRFSELDFWPQARAVPVSAALQANGANRLRPTGISADRQTLFLWNDAEQDELVATADPATGGFEAPESLGALRGATPNADCTRIYYSTATAGDESVELYVGELE